MTAHRNVQVSVYINPFEASTVIESVLGRMEVHWTSPHLHWELTTETCPSETRILGLMTFSEGRSGILTVNGPTVLGLRLSVF